LDFEQVKQGMKTEVQQLERLKVGRCLVERDGRALAKEKQVTVLTSRWVLTQKTSEMSRCRLVVRDFATGGTSALNAGIYAPTSSLDGLRWIYKDREKQGEDTPLTAEGEARYRRVLGQLAWAALSRADLCFSVSYLARFQSKPSGAAEACLRALLRWLLTRLHCVQIMPSPEGSPSVGPRSVVGFCDASWNVASMSGES